VNAEDIRNYCLSLENVEECFPFGLETLVFKIRGKLFLLLALDANPLQFNVKCEPVLALEYRERFAAVKPGYHMNKTHWNTVISDGSLKRSMLKDMINHSYQLVAEKNKSKSRKKPKKRQG
jgi:predicted DNA-binding protein (MmcQ/YjbR family)